MANAQQGPGPSRQLLAGNIAVPWPYEVWADGVYHRSGRAVAGFPTELQELPGHLFEGRKRICYRKLYISGAGITVDTAEPLTQLTFMDTTGQMRALWLSRGQITDTRQLMALGALGLPVDSNNAEAVLVYLRSMEADNLTMPQLKVGHRSGPYLVDNRLGWLIGKQWIGHGTLEADPRANQKYTLAFQPHGDPAAFYAKWKEVRNEGWVTRFLLGAAFAPSLLRLLKCRSFFIHHWCDSGGGKTAISMLALAIWGNTDILFSSLNRTSVSITEIFRHMTDLPVLFDEQQVSTVKPHELIYAVCLGSGRERGSKDGGLRQDKQTWLTVARTTGEQPLVADDDLGGQFNRLLQIHTPAFKVKRDAEAIYPFVASNYGHAGPDFLRNLYALLSHPGGEDGLRQLCSEFREALVNRSGVDSNHAQFGAVIATAQMLAESWLLGIPAAEAKEQALNDATEALRETAPKKHASYAERALAKLRDHWIANKLLYVDDTTAEGRTNNKFVSKMVGAGSFHGMAFIPHEADAVLRSADYVPERVWRDFQDNGWLVLADDGSPLKAWRLRNGLSGDHPCYVIRHEIFFTDYVRTSKRLRLVEGGLEDMGEPMSIAKAVVNGLSLGMDDEEDK